MGKFIDRTGQVFGRLTVTQLHSKVPHPTRWKCICVCGKEVIVIGADLQKGLTQSCGCLRREKAASMFTKHGKARGSTYKAWLNMVQRCQNEKHPRYSNWGGRGISVCERWQIFENFLEDMGEKPSPELTIERIDNDGNYEPGNCKWATMAEQNWNKRNTIRRG